MTGIAKAWVQFAGSTGTVNGSFNVSSVTRTSTGTYTMNFITPMPNANYAWSAGGYRAGNTANFGGASVSAPTTTSFVFVTFDASFNLTDMTLGCASIFSS
jgi:hypothetical protein